MPQINWSEVNAKLPYERNDEQRARRLKLFDGFDPNGNGYLSLAELDKGIRDILDLDAVFDCKPAIMAAYKAARNIGKHRGKHSADYVEKQEFRVFLKFLRQYFEYYTMFDVVDTEDDRRINLDEFKKAQGLLKNWGVVIEDPEAEFAKIDMNGGGQILFDEFAAWAMAHDLDVEDD